MQETRESLLAAPEDLGIVGANGCHLVGLDLAVVQRRAPVGRALEHCELLRRLRHFLDGLNAGRTGADHRDPLALEAHRLVRPARGVAALPLEGLDAVDARHGEGRERADGGDQEARGVGAAVLERDLPAPRLLVPVGRADLAAELDVAAQVELVGDLVQVAQRLGLGREMLRPVPLGQEFLGKRIAIGITLRVEARAGVAVPVPGASDTGSGLEHPDLHSEFAQSVKLEQAGHAGADDDRVEIGAPGVLSLARAHADSLAATVADLQRITVAERCQAGGRNRPAPLPLAAINCRYRRGP